MPAEVVRLTRAGRLDMSSEATGVAAWFKRLRGKTPQEMAGELYRHILGRPPESAEALKGAADQLGNLGWRVQIDVMINCEEYLGRFGDDTLPTAKEQK